MNNMDNNPLSADKLAGLFKTSNKDPLRIVNREGTRIEFKESYNHANMAQYFKTMASFANNSGGYIIFGIGDKPRQLLGLRDRNLKQFEEIKVEEFTNNLLDYFSPEIEWDHCTFEYKGMSFGVIYTKELKNKPCVCKKNNNSQNEKYLLKEGDIYYRYGGRSERIRYEELREILESVRKSEEQKWIDFTKRVAKVGIENAGILDLNSGEISGSGGAIILDESILSKISFIKEGDFVETGGTPTLRIIGDIVGEDIGKLVVKEKTKKFVKAIEPDDIIRAFLENKRISKPLEYIKVICGCTRANYPIYYFIGKSDKSVDDIIQMIENTTVRGITKKKLLERLQGKKIPKISAVVSENRSSQKKKLYQDKWINRKVSLIDEDISYCLTALLSLTDIDIYNNEKYIKNILLEIYERYYEKLNYTDASNLRKAICLVDEILFFKNI